MADLEVIPWEACGSDCTSDEWKAMGEKYEGRRVDWCNEAPGVLDRDSNYDCPLCHNKGVVAVLSENYGAYAPAFVECQCMNVRRSISKMEQSGLYGIIQNCTFDRFVATEKWQQTLKEAAQTYARQPVGWFYIGGQVGSGKTHLCSAIFRELLLAGRQAVYMPWRDCVTRLKAITKDPIYGEEISKYKRASVLYIDDLFKTGRAADSTAQQPTGADINIAFEILNHRYLYPQLVTIISSELTAEELVAIDEATGSRIIERINGIPLVVDKDVTKNYRLRHITKR